MSILPTLADRTGRALGGGLAERIGDSHFTVIGCGAIGTIFAEMLVRSGARHFFLVDGDRVEESNLNRCPAFAQADVGRNKAAVLKARLLAINAGVKAAVSEHFFEREESDAQRAIRRKIRNHSHVVLIAADNYAARFAIEEFLRRHPDIEYLSARVGVYPRKSESEPMWTDYECVWKPETDPNTMGDYAEGYGDGNASFAAIVMEAAAAAFGLLLHRWSGGSVRRVSHWHKNFLPDYATSSQEQ